MITVAGEDDLFPQADLELSLCVFRYVGAVELIDDSALNCLEVEERWLGHDDLLTDEHLEPILFHQHLAALSS